MSRAAIFLLILVLPALVGFAKGEDHDHLFTSIENLLSLFDGFKSLTTIIASYAQEHEDGNDEFQKFFSNYEKVLTVPQKDRKKFIGNPVNAYVLIRMLTEDLNTKFLALASQKDVLDLIFKDEALFNDLMPVNNDYVGAMTALNRLIRTYNFSIDDVMIGKFSETTRSMFQLDAFDCYKLANNSVYEDQEYDMAYFWAMKALQLLESNGQNRFVDRKDIYKILSQAAKMLGKRESAYWYLKEIAAADPNDRDSAVALDKFMDEMKAWNLTVQVDKAKPLKNVRLKNATWDKKFLYERLCRDDKDYIKLPKPLHCRYVNDHPFLAIGPIKEEQLYDDPPIWQFYDTITEKQAEHLKQVAIPKLKRAKVSLNGSIHSKVRITQMYFFVQEAKTDPVIKYLDYMVNAVSKLSMKEAEEWQIANYGIGGQYEPHTDHHYVNTHYVQYNGNRFATWLNYVEAPEIGGDTVFVNLGIKTKAISRSSVLWYSLNQTQIGGFETLHAACPVVVGSKWINNKWIHQNDQMFIKPCPLKLPA